MINRSISPAMQRAIEQFEQHGTLDGVHKNTVKALNRRGLVEESKTVLPELVGDAERYEFRWYDKRRLSYAPTRDARVGDYAFWDRARKGRAGGLEIAGAFLKPLENKISTWAIGMMPKFKTENDELASLVAEWWSINMPKLLRAMRESVGLGDCYIVFNGDSSLTVMQPHVVDNIVDPDDWSNVIGYRITESYSHPDINGLQTIQDDYYADRRERIIYMNGMEVRRRRFPNPLGIIPVVKIKNNASPDEENGRPEGEALIKILEWYNDVFVAALEGNIRQGRPTPVIETDDMEALASFWEKFGVNETYTDQEGNQQVKKVIKFNSDSLLTVIGRFRYAQPGSFAGDTEKLLGLLFYLILQYTEIPEFIWGNAIASSKASAESQMAPFARFIEGKRAELSWVRELLKIVVMWYSMMNVGIREDDVVSIEYPELTNEDGRLTLDAVSTGLREGLLDDETALRLMPLDIDNPAAVIEAMRLQNEEEMDRLDARRAAQSARDVDMEPEPADNSEEPSPPVPAETVSEAEEDYSNSVMVAFFLDDSSADRLVSAARMAGLNPDPDELHITLAYLGEKDDLVRSEVEGAVEQFADMQTLINGQVSGFGRFQNTHMDGMDAIYASFDSPDVGMFRENLVRTLMDAGVQFSRNHGFTPHITLGYVPSEADTPPLKVPVMDVSFGEVVLSWGDERQSYRLVQGDSAAVENVA